jgi:hypothetical protein
LKPSTFTRIYHSESIMTSRPVSSAAGTRMPCRGITWLTVVDNRSTSL